MEQYFGENTPKLGFGLMRPPKLRNEKIDLEQTSLTAEQKNFKMNGPVCSKKGQMECF